MSGVEQLVSYYSEVVDSWKGFQAEAKKQDLPPCEMCVTNGHGEVIWKRPDKTVRLELIDSVNFFVKQVHKDGKPVDLHVFFYNKIEECVTKLKELLK